MGRRRKPLTPAAPVRIESLDDGGRGRAEAEGWTLAVAGALPGETASVRVHRRRGRRLEATAVTVQGAAPERVRPACPWTARCGGCALQHLERQAQLAMKAGRLERQLERAGAPAPERWLAPLTGPAAGYRHKARLGVRHVPGKGGVLVGFRERGSARVADVDACRVLVPAIGERLGRLRALLDGLESRARIPQLEVAAGDRAAAIVVRHLEPLGARDLERLVHGCRELGLELWLQPAGPASVRRVWPAEGPERLGYALPAFGIELAFHPLDFTQVNFAVNRELVTRAIELLAPEPHERVVDLFCGLGNFTLPLATRCAEVTGVEGSEALVARAWENAARNDITNVRFEPADLYDGAFDPRRVAGFDRVLLDPPRSGAEALARGLAEACGGGVGPMRIVYVSCNPESLARDIAILCAGGYRLRTVGLVDMFPHTAHVEAVAMLDAGGGTADGSVAGSSAGTSTATEGD